MAKTPIKYYVVDAFTESAFKGNPAAVCLLDQERDEDWLQCLAAEFNISETCYLTRIAHSPSLSPRFRLRWFTPVTEVDAFTESAFKGNPAAVCLLDQERDEDWLQCLAVEFNMSQTGYLTRIAHLTSLSPRFRLRWFTPVTEVKLCGHATLAAAHILFSTGLVDSDLIEFETLSGILTAKRIPDVLGADKSSQNGGEDGAFMIQLDFPIVPLTDSSAIDASAISKALNGASFLDMKRTATEYDLLVELPSGKSVSEFQPQIDEIQKCPGRGMIITAVAPPESGFDFISRFFCPKYGINEDPVCGSAHCALATYWSEKLRKSDFVAYQASPRGGILKIQLDKQTQRVLLQGKAVTVMEGSILV